MSKIWVDAGHGGTEPGACANGIVEKNINLIVSLELKRLLENAGHQVGMTRLTDLTVSLGDRCRSANEWKADYFISVHHNAGGGDGYECIHSIYHGEGEHLALEIAETFKALGQNPHGSKAVYDREGKNGDYYYVIKHTKMFAVITEYAFLDTKDVSAVDTKEELLQEAYAIYTGFRNAIGG